MRFAPRPVVGFPLDHEPGGGYSKLPWFALRENYCTAVSALGAIPLALPHEAELAEAYLDLLDGLVITGGAFDIHPALYGEDSVHDTVTLKEDRTAFEMSLTRAAIARNMPVLGICGGEQLLAVALGGTLIQHIPDAFPASPVAHEQTNPRSEPGHAVEVLPGTLLHRIVGASRIEVNSAHHQAVAAPGEGVRVNALAPDGVIEGIELPAHPFCLGVQWHPEYHVSEADTRIFQAFVEACREYGG
jgi:putative glutamine amidotransferase